MRLCRALRKLTQATANIRVGRPLQGNQSEPWEPGRGVGAPASIPTPWGSQGRPARKSSGMQSQSRMAKRGSVKWHSTARRTRGRAKEKHYQHIWPNMCRGGGHLHRKTVRHGDDGRMIQQMAAAYMCDEVGTGEGRGTANPRQYCHAHAPRTHGEPYKGIQTGRGSSMRCVHQRANARVTNLGHHQPTQGHTQEHRS